MTESCPHDQGFRKDYILGSDTGDRVCRRCGEEFSRAEWIALALLGGTDPE